jgi:purine-binding chemotaxis protein CheW
MSEIQLPASGLAEDILPRYKEKKRDFHLVTFNLGEEYGVPIHQVQEIIRVSGITMVPNSPSYMEGVINLRGRVLPVLNLRRKLKLSPQDIGKESRIVVAEAGDKVIGLLVDAVSHVIKVSPESVESAPEEVLEIDTDYITGVGKLKNRLVILLDLEKLLRRENIEVRDVTDEGGEHAKED